MVGLIKAGMPIVMVIHQPARLWMRDPKAWETRIVSLVGGSGFLAAIVMDVATSQLFRR